MSDAHHNPDYHQARAQLRHAGLPFPFIPPPLRHRLGRHQRWLYATRPVGRWPYLIDDYVAEAQHHRVPDYALIAHAGHGFNSYALHFFLVHGPLQLFVQMGWGGAYMDDSMLRPLRAVFALCRPLILAAERLRGDAPMTVSISEFYGSAWRRPGEPPLEVHGMRDDSALDVMHAALVWLDAPAPR